ncbi:MAG: hypothetical protein GY898_06770 [Proteobacteria bacterium]|nr:hypothetical protein [Pseudomonadota bacterium]
MRFTSIAIAAGLSLVVTVAFAADFQSKADWSAKIIKGQQVSKKLCAADAYLLTCTTELTDPETGEKGKLDAATCTESVDATVAYMLADGSAGPVGAMYNKLPANLGAGQQMDEVATMIGKEVGTSVMGAVMQLAGSWSAPPSETRRC